MKKFLLAGFAIFAFLFLASVDANAQSCRWRGSRSYRTVNYEYAPRYSYRTVEYGYAPRYSYRRHRRYSARRRGVTIVARYGPVVTYSYRPVRRYYSYY